MKSTDSDDFAIPDEDKKISEMVIKFTERPGENPSTRGIESDQPLNFFNLIQFGFSNHWILLVYLPTGGQAGPTSMSAYFGFSRMRGGHDHVLRAFSIISLA
jgi:hypothetical protein